MRRKGDTLEYMRRMQQELFDCPAEAHILQELARAREPRVRAIYSSYLEGRQSADVRELAIRHRVSRLNFSLKVR